MSWLSDALEKCDLPEKVEDHLLGRGLKESTIKSEQMVSWTPTEEIVDEGSFVYRYGEHGERLEGMAICPAWSPKGKIIGFEARDTTKKFITDYRLPEAAWNPFWLGLNQAMQKIWDGGDVWVSEGLFDMSALEWAVPETDAVLSSVRAKLTRRHVEFLQRFCKGHVHMVYDRDEAGRHGVLGYIDEATGKRRWGALDSLRHVGLKCRDVPYNGGKDPGEIWDYGGVIAVRKAFPFN